MFELITQEPKVCEICGGAGYTIEVVAECCGNYKEFGCCGVPNPVQVQVECKCDGGFEPIEKERGINIILIGAEKHTEELIRKALLENKMNSVVIVGSSYLSELDKELCKVKEILMPIKSLEPIPLAAHNYEFIQQKNYSSRRARREEERKNKKKYHGR